MTAMSSVLDKKYLKIPCSEIQLGARFSAPVFLKMERICFWQREKPQNSTISMP